MIGDPDSVSSDRDDASLQCAMEQGVVLVESVPGADDAFVAERDRLLQAFPDVLVDVVRIGSTGIDNLPTKPIVDLLAGVRTMEAAFAVGRALPDVGYAAVPSLNAALHDRQFFLRHEEGRRTHHLHVVVHGSPAWNDRVRFRARLLASDDLRDRYAALKRALALRHGDDRDAYSEGKTTFIAAALAGDGDPG